MATNHLIKQDKQQEPSELTGSAKLRALAEVSSQFQICATVDTLQRLMTEVTNTKITPESVNAACNCVQNLNLTIKTAMQAAKFLSDKE